MTESPTFASPTSASTMTRGLGRLLSGLAAVAMLASATALEGCKRDLTSCEALGQERVRWFEDRDRDGFGNLVAFVEDCNQPDDYVADPTDCDDLRPSVYPGAAELCDGLDNNCNFAVDENLSFNDYFVDADADGFGDPALQVEACSLPPGHAPIASDCDDTNPDVNIDAVEICDEIDNDCNEFIDDNDAEVDLTTGTAWHPDSDGDSFGDSYTEIIACAAPPGTLADATDCDDADEVINPDNTEVCNGVDDDCDQLYDDSDPDIDPSTQTEYFPDHDADGVGVPGPSIFTCTTPWYYAETTDDCDDEDPLLLSATTTTWLVDGDLDGFGAGEPSAPSCTPPDPTGWASHVAGEDCDDADPEVSPDADEICNGIDDDCDTLIDDADLPEEEGGVLWSSMTRFYLDEDLDGFGDPAPGFAVACVAPEGLVALDGDCDDANPLANPAQTEICNGGVDDDCNGPADDADPGLDLLTSEVWVRDFDGDGWGDLNTLTRACEQPAGFVTTFGDCDDEDPFITLPTVWWEDTDGDLQGAGVPGGAATCDAPSELHVPYYVGGEADCAPDDPLAYSGPEICYDGIDQGCDGTDFVTVGTCNLDLPDTCEDAQLWIPLLPAGQIIQGDLSDATNNLNPGAIGCTGAQATAKDEILPLTIPMGTTLSARLQVQMGDASVYVLPSCASAASCVAGMDASANNSTNETVLWTNDTGADAVVFLVIDGFEPIDSRTFTLTLNLL